MIKLASSWAVQIANSARDRVAALKRTGKLELVEPLEIFRRDRWICQICFRPVYPNSIDPYNSNRVTIDHRPPLAQGGNHTWSNLQTAHLSCNASKGAKPQPNS